MDVEISQNFGASIWINHHFKLPQDSIGISHAILGIDDGHQVVAPQVAPRGQPWEAAANDQHAAPGGEITRKSPKKSEFCMAKSWENRWEIPCTWRFHEIYSWENHLQVGVMSDFLFRIFRVVSRMEDFLVMQLARSKSVVFDECCSLAKQDSQQMRTRTNE